MSESGGWYRMTDEEKLRVIAELPGRKAALDRGELGGYNRGRYEDD